jgi:hypothetical protein
MHIFLLLCLATLSGKLPVKIEGGFDYSLAYEDDYGERWKFKLQITPVIPALIKKALFH